VTSSGQTVFAPAAWPVLQQPLLQLADVLRVNPYLSRNVFLEPPPPSSASTAATAASPTATASPVVVEGRAVLVHGWMVAWDTLWKERGRDSVMNFIDDYDEKVAARRARIGLD
jgi:hypothetical protein